MASPPPGFVPTIRRSNFIDMLGPLYERIEGPDFRIGLLMDERHTNLHDKGHGGLIATVLDIIMGRVIGHASDHAKAFTTISMTIDYLKPAPKGSWLEARAEIDRIGRNIGYSRGKLFADNVLIARGSGIFQLSDVAADRMNSDA